MAQVLQPLNGMFPEQQYPQLLVGLDRPDDSAIYRINDEQAIISTTDFFPPVVDDPYDFGAIAAANALSDVYAMGGKVLFAMNLVAFPADLDTAILGEILRGGAEKVAINLANYYCELGHDVSFLVKYGPRHNCNWAPLQ